MKFLILKRIHVVLGVSVLAPLALGSSGCARSNNPTSHHTSAAPTSAADLLALPPEETPRNLDDSLCPDYQEIYDAKFASLTTIGEVIDQLGQELPEYGLKFVAQAVEPGSSDTSMAWDPLGPSNLSDTKRFAAAFATAWKRNTVEWVRKSTLQTVYLTSRIAIDGQRRSAAPDIRHQAVWYDPTMLGSCLQSNEEIIHHEFYHVVEAAHFGTYYYKDPAWALFNLPDFAYGSGGAAAYTDPGYHAGGHPRPGFVTTYATYGLEEDKAETYGWLRTPKDAAQVMEWAKSDDSLAKKVAYMRDFIARESEALSSP